MSPEEIKLREVVDSNPEDWSSRKKLSHLLYDQGKFVDAANLIWGASEIPSVDLELAFAAKILAKGAPRKAIRLLSAVLEQNRRKPVQNLGVANALLHHGMVLQASRFYGAALEADPSFANPDLEHFMLWTDDEETIWNGFEERRPTLGELPWMTRDPEEALELTTSVRYHTSPIQVPNLQSVPGEQLENPLYRQKAVIASKPTPPPAVTIPIDRVALKHRRFDEKLGARTVVSGTGPVALEAAQDEAAQAGPPKAKPVEKTAKPSGTITGPEAPKALPAESKAAEKAQSDGAQSAEEKKPHVVRPPLRLTAPLRPNNKASAADEAKPFVPWPAAQSPGT